MDLSADVGEGADDEPLLAFVTSVSVACGVHAGDEETMARVVEAAVQRGLAIGAHPGYPDRAGKGRAAVAMTHAEIASLVEEQVRALARVATRFGARLRHVKPHGALYNQAAVDEGIADAVVAGGRAADRTLAVVGLAGSALPGAALHAGMHAVHEAFADRRYRADGTLVPRGEPGAVIDEPDVAAEQAQAVALGEPILTTAGTWLSVRAQSICVHADSPRAVEVVAAVARALTDAGVDVSPAG